MRMPAEVELVKTITLGLRRPHSRSNWENVLPLCANVAQGSSFAVRLVQGILIEAAGIVLGFLAIALYLYVIGAPPGFTSKSYTPVLIFMSPVAICHQIAKKRWARRAYEVSETDRFRPPVLLLRPFSVDQSLSFVRNERVMTIGPELRTVKFEEDISKRLSFLGPIITAGRPGETRGETGAARLWMPAESWPQCVDLLLRESQVIVILVGDSPSKGLGQELHQVISQGYLNKVLFAIPETDESKAKTAWDALQAVSDGWLPQYQSGMGLLRLAPDCSRWLMASNKVGALDDSIMEKVFVETESPPSPLRLFAVLVIVIFLLWLVFFRA